MINSKRAKLAAIAALILVFATVLLYMRLFPGQEKARMVSLAFIVVGIALPVIGYIRIEDSQARQMGPGLRAGVYLLLVIYGLSAVSMSVLLMLLGAGAGLIATLEIVLTMAFGAAFTFAAVLGGDRVKNNTRALEAVAFMRALEEDIYRMSREKDNMKFNARLKRIEEAVRYSDYSGLTSFDAGLAEKIRELKYALLEVAESRAGSNYDNSRDELLDKQIEIITEDILRLIQDRNRELINEKKARSLNG